jgi:hypothetical protein
MWLLQLINWLQTLNRMCQFAHGSYNACISQHYIIRLHVNGGYMYIQSTVSGTVFTVGPIPVYGAFCVSRSMGGGLSLW